MQRASTGLPQSATYSAPKAEGFSRLADLDEMVKNMLSPGNERQGTPGKRPVARQHSAGVSAQPQPNLPSLSPLQRTSNMAQGNGDFPLSGTDVSSSPGGSTSISLPPPLQMPDRSPDTAGNPDGDGFLELATRSNAVEEKVPTYKSFIRKAILFLNQHVF